jgi:acetyl esterase/lipase
MTSDGIDRDGQAALRRERAERIAQLGPELSPENIEASFGLFAAAHQDLGYEAPVLTRDVAYGGDPRQRLDVHSAFEPGWDPGDTGPVPVLVYVHGGGFVGGDKHIPGSPYYDNVGGWAVRHGMVGVTITYRLAPQHQWPAGAQDVGQAVAWAAENIGDYGGDPARVVVAGHSAGATHVAGYLAGHGGGPARVAAGALLSGIYELPPGDPDETQAAYFGADTSQYPSRSPLQDLVASGVPVLFAVAEHDLSAFHHQAALALQAFLGRDEMLPPFAYVPDHNHISEIAALGIDDEPLGIPLLRFIESVTGAPLPRPERPLPAATGSPSGSLPDLRAVTGQGALDEFAPGG